MLYGSYTLDIYSNDVGTCIIVQNCVLGGEARPGGKAKRFTVVYNGKRQYAAVKGPVSHHPTQYTAVPHSIPPDGLLEWHFRYAL